MKKRLTIRFLRRFAFVSLTFLLAFSTQVYGQNARQVTVRDASTLKELINQIQTGSEYRFSWQDDLVKGVGFPALTMKAPIDDILRKALHSTGIDFNVHQYNVILTRKASTTAKTEDRTVNGVVRDAVTGEPLIGATVWLKDTAIGVITGSDGSYSLTFPPNYLVMSVSYIGYETLEVVVGQQTAIDVSLTPSSREIDDVVVIGYGQQKKASIIGAISSVPVSAIQTPVSKLSTSLVGQLSGVITTQRNGEPGAGTTNFWIRGISTFGSNSDPLILVDGVEREMDLVDVEDIQEFSILKDASATAIYGVRGANGVVLITTRKGYEGKPVISVKLEGGLVKPTKLPKMINSIQFAEMYNDAIGYEYYSPTAIEAYGSGTDPDLYPNTNWMQELFDDYATNQRLNINVSGGSSTVNYFIAGGFYNENGIYKQDNMNQYNTSVFYRRFNFRSNVDVKLHRYTTLNVNLATTFERKNQPGTSSSDIWDAAFNVSPNAFPLLFSNGLLPGPPAREGENPYVLLTQTGYTEQFYNTAQSLFGLTQDFGSWVTPGLTANIKGSFDAKNENTLSRKKTPPQYLANGRDEDGELILNNTRTGEESLSYSESKKGARTVYLEASVNYARTFGRNSVTGLFLYQQSQKNYVGVSTSEEALPYRHQGIAARVSYDYDYRYFIEANFGYNGSENFSPGKRFGFFPAVAAGWMVSNEKFFAPVTNVVDMLKLRGSFGYAGNDQIGGKRRFIYNATVTEVSSSQSTHFGDGSTSYPTIRLGDWANPHVGWEKSRKLNTGVDISLFRKVRIQADYFEEKRSGIFLERNSIPLYAGVSTDPWVNIGKMNNAGFDGSIDYFQTIGQVQLTARGTFTYARNVIIDNDEPTPAYPYLSSQGQARWQKQGLIAVGLFQSQEEIDAWPLQNFGQVQPGDIKYLDLNGDGVVDVYDMKPIGYTDIPEIIYGFGVSAKWRGIDISVFFQGAAHVNFFTNNTQTQAFTARNLIESGIFSDVYGNYWTPDNPGARYPRLTIGTNENNDQTSTFWLADGKYLRLKNVEIGYTLPKKVCSAMKIKGMRVYASGVNLVTFTKFKLWDVDLQGSYSRYPNNRIVNLGISIDI